MTQPGSLIAPQPGWWVRSENVGVNLSGEYGWASDAHGIFVPVGHKAGTYGWASAASGVTVHASVSFDAVGAGAGSAVAVASLSWSHTATAGAYVIVDVGTALTPTSVKYGGVSMTLLGSQAVNNNPAQGAIFRYGLVGVAGGAKTVVVTFSSASAGNGASVSYNNVGVVGALQTAYGDGTTTASQSITCFTGQYIVQGIGAADAATMTVSGGTDRYAAFTGGASLAITDSSSSTTFSTSTGAGVWGAVATVLAPITQTAAASKTITPIISASVSKTIHIAGTRTVTPAFGMSVSEVIHGSASLLRNPSIAAAANFHPRPGAVAKNVTPAITGAVSVHSTRTGNTVNATPTISAGMTKTIHISAARADTRTISASATKSSGVATYDTTGAGARTTSTTSISWSHTAAAGAGVIVAVSTSSSSTVSSVTWDGSAMTLLGSQASGGNSSNGTVYLFGLTGAGTGSAVTVAVTASSSTTLAGNSVSYVNALSFGTPVGNSGSGTSLSTGSVTSATNHIAFAAFLDSTKSISGFSQTQRSSLGTGGTLTMGDAAGAATVSFTATGGGGSPWGAIAVDIV